MKKVLIVTYYWPPSGDPGVQRLLKFAKYLPQLGWEPIILTVANGEYSALDMNLEKDIPEGVKVFKTQSLEPSVLYKKFVGMRPDEKIPVANVSQKNLGWKRNLSNWIRLNLFIPDAKIGWSYYAVKEGKRIIAQEKPDLIFSSSPPATVHLIAKRLAKWSGLRWVADFRDPWTDIYHYDGVNRLPVSKSIDLKLEQKVVKRADKVVTVSQGFADLLIKDPTDAPKVNIIANGFDEEDFLIEDLPKSDKFRISYSGKISPTQNPKELWTALSDLLRTNVDFAHSFELMLIGNIASEIVVELDDCGLSGHVNLVGYVPYTRMLQLLQEASLLLVLIPNTKNNKGIVTGKVYSYLACNRFVLGIGPEDGDAADLLRDTCTGHMYEFDNTEAIKTEVLRQFHHWKSNTSFVPNTKEINLYTRKQLTRDLVQVFENAL